MNIPLRGWGSDSGIFKIYFCVQCVILLTTCSRTLMTRNKCEFSQSAGNMLSRTHGTKSLHVWCNVTSDPVKVTWFSCCLRVY